MLLDTLFNDHLFKRSLLQFVSIDNKIFVTFNFRLQLLLPPFRPNLDIMDNIPGPQPQVMDLLAHAMAAEARDLLNLDIMDMEVMLVTTVVVLHTLDVPFGG